jgi:hypothetical protein
VSRVAPRFAASTAALFVLGGCIFILPPIEAGDACAIEGSTDCATCIRENCQSEVNACCGDALCGGARSLDLSGTMPLLDACGRGDGQACSQGLAAAQSGASGAVRTCVSTKCRSLCSKPLPSAWTCAAELPSGTRCTDCVRTKCGDAVKRCCEGKSCTPDSDVVKELRACVAGDEPACAYAQIGSEDGLDGIVRNCLVESCKGDCMGTGLPYTRCQVFSAGTYCSCSWSNEASGTECNGNVVANGTCVIANEGCFCGSYACGPSTLGCSCGFRGSSAGGTGTCRAPRDGRCCIKYDSSSVTCGCERSTSACSATVREFAIDDCEPETVLARLRDIGRIVESCSR